ncbi:MAG: rhomboid family intramembrane serine protease [Candidatus Helarchaeota archaeon]
MIEEPRPKKRPTLINWILIILCVIIFIITLDPKTGLNIDENIALTLGFTPAYFYKTHTLITSAFLHGDWFHLIGNMYFLYVFGDDAEDILGRFTYLVFYLFCAVIASLFFGIVTIATAGILGDPTILYIPAIGASGAIFGVLAAYAIFLPNRTLLIPGWGRVPAKFYVLIYAAMETIYVFSSAVTPGDNVAHAAHVGGFLAGVFFVYIFRKFFQNKYEYAKTNYLPAGRTKKTT